MFKAKLIENESYYKLRSKHLLLMLLPSLPMILIVNFYQIPIWLTILMIGLYVLAIIPMIRNQKRLSAIVGNKQIEIDNKEIRIKSKKGIQQEIIHLNKIDKLILKDIYSMPQETIGEVVKEMSGKAKQNYLILEQNSQKRRLDFEIDSYYMVNQLDKIIKNWKANGYNIEQLENI